MKHRERVAVAIVLHGGGGETCVEAEGEGTTRRRATFAVIESIAGSMTMVM
jgi:hypothetical protein